MQHNTSVNRRQYNTAGNKTGGTQRLRILFITLYYPPEMGAPQARISDLAVRLVRRGHSVTVLTGFPNYPSGIIPPEYRRKWRMYEEKDGVRIVRSWIYPVANVRLYARLINYLSFVFSSIINSFYCGKADAVYVESPPLFNGINGYIISRIKRAPYLFHVADIWPDFAVELGLIKPGIFLSAAYWLERFIYKKAACVATVTSGFLRRLRDDKHIPDKKLVLITNGVDVTMFHTGISVPEQREQLGLTDKFIAGYIGNIGHWQGVETLIDTAILLKDNSRFHLLIIGDGARRQAVEEYISARKPSNVTLLPAQPRADIPKYLSILDCALVPLRNIECTRQTLPVKMFEAMAMAKPIIIGGTGDSQKLIEETHTGIAVEPENPRAYEEAIKTLMADPTLREQMGYNGRKLAESRFNRDLLADVAESVFLSMAEERKKTHS